MKYRNGTSGQTWNSEISNLRFRFVEELSVMKLIPVLDILNGLAVRAVGGVRNEYRPLQSLGCQSSRPIDIARSIRTRFGFKQWYVADLDGIVHRQWNRDILEELLEHGFSLTVDPGIRSIEDLYQIRTLQEKTDFIIASESLVDCSMLELLAGMINPESLTFSLDLIEGKMIFPGGAWGNRTIGEVVDYVYQCGLRKMIVLDLAYIGCNKGIGTLEICKQLKANFPELEIATGGGVRTSEQLSLLEQAGVHTAMLGSALHNGQLSPQDLVAHCPAELDP